MDQITDFATKHKEELVIIGISTLAVQLFLRMKTDDKKDDGK